MYCRFAIRFCGIFSKIRSQIIEFATLANTTAPADYLLEWSKTLIQKRLDNKGSICDIICRRKKFSYKGIEMKSVNLKFVFVFLLSIAMVLSVSACGADSDGDSDGTESSATEAPAGDIVPSYVFTNTGSVEICELYLSPADTQDWGPDQLKSQTIATGATFTLTNIPAGQYDAKAVGCDGAGEAIGQLDIQN
jgi:hypothetical protein